MLWLWAGNPSLQLCGLAPVSAPGLNPLATAFEACEGNSTPGDTSVRTLLQWLLSTTEGLMFSSRASSTCPGDCRALQHGMQGVT